MFASEGDHGCQGGGHYPRYFDPSNPALPRQRLRPREDGRHKQPSNGNKFIFIIHTNSFTSCASHLQDEVVDCALIKEKEDKSPLMCQDHSKQSEADEIREAGVASEKISLFIVENKNQCKWNITGELKGLEPNMGYVFWVAEATSSGDCRDLTAENAFSPPTTVTTDADGKGIIQGGEFRLFSNDSVIGMLIGKMVVLENPQTTERVACALINEKEDEVPLESHDHSEQSEVDEIREAGVASEKISLFMVENKNQRQTNFTGELKGLQPNTGYVLWVAETTSSGGCRDLTKETAYTNFYVTTDPDGKANIPRREVRLFSDNSLIGRLIGKMVALEKAETGEREACETIVEGIHTGDLIDAIHISKIPPNGEVKATKSEADQFIRSRISQ